MTEREIGIGGHDLAGQLDVGRAELEVLDVALQLEQELLRLGRVGRPRKLRRRRRFSRVYGGRQREQPQGHDVSTCAHSPAPHSMD
jgi:hypothetical protein